jgi:hypothetical protein
MKRKVATWAPTEASADLIIARHDPRLARDLGLSPLEPELELLDRVDFLTHVIGSAGVSADVAVWNLQFAFSSRLDNPESPP